MLKRNRQRGFTLIELLIVVAIIGIIAAILIPNLLDALQKAKQKRTISDIRNTGTAWMSWLTDQVGAASAGQASGGGTTFYGKALSVSVSYGGLYKYLRPSDTFFYMQEVPEFDGWNNPLAYRVSGNILDASVMALYAQCRDKSWNTGGGPGENVPVYGFLSTDYDQDIIWADGYFVSWPEGTKR